MRNSGPLAIDDTTISVYEHLVADPSADLEALQARAKLDRAALREVLDRLVQTGLVRQADSGDTASLRVDNPDVIVNAAVEAQLDQMATAVDTFRAARALSLRLHHAYQRANHNKAVLEFERISGANDIAARIAHLGAHTTTSIEAVMTGCPTPEMIAAARPAEAEHARHGIQLRSIYPARVRSTPWLAVHGAWLADHGGQIRTTTHPGTTQFILFDRHTALVTADPAPAQAPAAVLVSTTGVVNSLAALFDLHWAAGSPLPEPELSTGALTGIERDLLKLMNEGLKDTAIARELGISTRTLGRILSSLCERLKTDSRFALGAAAARAGLI